jgi:hypothetical protein
MTITDKMPLASAERRIRSRLAAAGEIQVWADAARYRKLKQLAARLDAKPVPGGDWELIAPEGAPGEPGLHRSATVADQGGVLVISSAPFPAM